MKSKYKRYEKYKPSGVEWLGDVPENWEVDRLRRTVFGCKNGIWGNEPDGVDDLVCVRVADFDRTKFRVMVDEPTIRAVTPSERRGRLLQQGDLLLEKSGGGELQPVGAVMLFEHDIDAVCSNFVARMPVKDRFDSVFLTYLHAHLYARRVNTRSIKQTTGIQNLDSMAYLDERVACPPLTEQQAITDFLDRRMGLIDELITKKEQVIELLREKRTALISHAVTKGLNPDAKMKDSGVDWLGEIPEHWEVKRLRHIIKDTLVNGLFKKKEHFGSGVNLINVFDIYRDNFLVDTDSLERVEANKTEIEKYAVKSGDIFFVRSSLKLEGVGKSVCILDVAEPTVFECHVVRARPDTDQILPVFLINYLNSTITMDRLISLANMVTMTTLDQIKIKDIEVAVPPILEQIAIAKYLKQEYLKTDTLVSKVTEAIEKLKEYRTALISATVTGKIDVREEGGKQ